MHVQVMTFGVKDRQAYAL